ncbi:MAG: phosphoribosylformylglycinamidine synthase subunit PurL [candidate division WOR-3 bacterium]
MFTQAERDAIKGFLGREPNPTEEAVFSVLWSEHCSYKSSRPYLKMLPTEAPWVLQGPGENAGILRLKNGYCAAFKMESHNHPSAVEPVHGAATGIGGIIRDILSVGARPVALADSLRFGPLSDERSKWLFEGVVHGISFYGNSVGVPTVAGEVYFDESYKGNPLVNVMCVGIMREEDFMRARLVGPGNPIILAGSTTGRDGMGGAAFASEDLVGDTEEKRPAVQVGDPFMEKLLIEATLEALATGAILGIQDLGAGGLSGLGEMAHKGGLGAEIFLERVPLRVPDLQSWEILISESQERMVMCVEAGREREVIDIYHKWDLNAEVIGHVIEEPVFRVWHRGQVVAEIPSEALGACPVRDLPRTEPARISVISRKSPRIPDIPWDAALIRLVSEPDVADKTWVFRQYDHTVMTNTALVPGAADAAVMRIKGQDFGIALTVDCNARFLHMDPREGSRRAVCEAMRNLVAVGAMPLGITDCLNFASPEDPEVLWDFAEAVAGLSEAAAALNIPVVSGNVSFYNQTETHKVFPTPVIGMVGLLDDVSLAVRAGFPQEGLSVFLIGRAGSLTGSLYQAVFSEIGGRLEQTDLYYERRLAEAVLAMHSERLLLSCHDVSDGGLLVAIAESCILNRIGVSITSPESPEFLFGEGRGAFVVSARPEHESRVLAIAEGYGVPATRIGITGGGEMLLNGRGVSLSALEEAYSSIEKEMEG